MHGTNAIGARGMLALAVACLCVSAAAAQPKVVVPARLEKLPAGWRAVKSTLEPERDLGGRKVQVTRTVLAVDGEQLQVNIIGCKTDEDAAGVYDAIQRGFNDKHGQRSRDGKSVIEFVCKDLRLLERAYGELGFKPPRATYEVSFHAAPITKCDYMQWNPLCSAAFANEPKEEQVRELAKTFTFGDKVRLRSHGLGGEKTAAAFTPPAREPKLEADGELTTHAFAELPRRYGLPAFAAALTVSCDAYALTPSQRKAGPELLGPNAFWPSDDRDIAALAAKITEGKTTARAKAAAILEWFKPDTFRYGGAAMGTRFGVKKALQQQFGRCWDFSDIYVTLCRAAGVPSRQVLGWLHGEGGHLWAEVLIEGEGWRQVDPTSGLGCDCRYIPFSASEDGAMSFVYLSRLTIKKR